VPVEGNKCNWRGVQVEVQRGDDDVEVVVLDVGEGGLAGALWMRGGGVGEGVKGTVKFLSRTQFLRHQRDAVESDRARADDIGGGHGAAGGVGGAAQIDPVGGS
jgi:hypothetical protein